MPPPFIEGGLSVQRTAREVGVKLSPVDNILADVTPSLPLSFSVSCSPSLSCFCSPLLLLSAGHQEMLHPQARPLRVAVPWEAGKASARSSASPVRRTARSLLCTTKRKLTMYTYSIRILDTSHSRSGLRIGRHSDQTCYNRRIQRNFYGHVETNLHLKFDTSG